MPFPRPVTTGGVRGLSGAAPAAFLSVKKTGVVFSITFLRVILAISIRDDVGFLVARDIQKSVKVT